MGPRVFPILSLLFVLFALSTFANAFPSNVDLKEAMDDGQDWTKLTECYDFLAAVKRSSNGYRRCILDRIRNVNATRSYYDEEIFSALSSAVNACVSIGPWRCLDIRRIPGPMFPTIVYGGPKEKYKYAIPPRPSGDSSAECVAVFVDGLARQPDVNTSFELLKLAPGCRLHLAHPIDDRNFTAIGQFHPLALSKSPTETPTPCKVEMYGGVIQNTTCMDINDFLESLELKKPSFVDYLWFEDSWWSGFKYTHQAYSVLMDEPRDVTICQILTHISTRFYHGPEGGFKHVVTNVLEKSGFIPLRSEFDSTGPTYRRYRELYFNVASSYCVLKYLAPQFGDTLCGTKATIQKEKVIKGQFEIDSELIRME